LNKKKEEKTDLKIEEKKKKRIEHILNFSHDGNTLEDVPSHLLNNPNTTTTTTTITSATSTTTTTKLSFMQGVA